MTRLAIGWLLLLSLLTTGCPKREQPPPSAYDPDLMRTAEQVAEQEQAQEQAGPAAQPTGATEAKAECDRETGGCPAGYLCWDSWYCKQGRDEQCSAMGDKRCHKRCFEDADCPGDMPLCREKPLFKGSDRGVLEKFCVAEE